MNLKFLFLTLGILSLGIVSKVQTVEAHVFESATLECDFGKSSVLIVYDKLYQGAEVSTVWTGKDPESELEKNCAVDIPFETKTTRSTDEGLFARSSLRLSSTCVMHWPSILEIYLRYKGGDDDFPATVKFSGQKIEGTCTYTPTQQGGVGSRG